MEPKYAIYQDKLRNIADLKNALSLMQWDQETYLPKKGAGFRGQQMATLSEHVHQLSIAGELESLLQDLNAADNLTEIQKKNVELSWQDYSKQKKYSPAFVRTMSETVSRCYHTWIEARNGNDFGLFEKDLQALVELKRQETDLLGYRDHPYNAMLDEFEKGCTVSQLDDIFLELIPPLKNLLDNIQSKQQVDDSFLHQHFPKSEQWDYGLALIIQLGFDFQAGRQDLSEHPFSTSFNCRDVRITTRINENNFGSMTWSCLHEAGHGLYEQGLPESEYGLPSGEFASLSVHESQSRLWENSVGRSLDFWTGQFPVLRKQFPQQLEKVTTEAFYKGINKVHPTLIRTEADELTYHFHVIIRYELEKLLLTRQLAVRDIPAYWNEQYRKYLGLTVPDDRRGCLQDVHWSHGSFGYFPTYSLGSFYAAQWFEAASTQLPGLSDSLLNGQTQNLLAWLRQHIHQFGRLYTSAELSKKASGEELRISHFLRYLLDKYKKIYDL